MRMTELDSTIFEELIDLDPEAGIELVRELVRIFFEEAPGRIERLRQGLAQGDSHSVAQAAHATRGGAAGLGATGLAAVCAAIERQARTGNLTGLDAEVAAIVEGLPLLEEKIAKLVQRFAAQQVN